MTLRTIVLLVSLGMLAACGGGASNVTAFDGALRLRLTSVADEARDGDKFAWHLDDGVVVTAQRIAADDGTLHRSVESVATALGERFRFGEVRGVFSFERASLGRHRFVATSARIEVDDETWVRRGFLVAKNGQIYLIESVGEESNSIVVDEHLRELRSSVNSFDE